MHYGHDHHHNGAAIMRETTPGVGHNAPAARPVQWQTPHRPDDAPPVADRAPAETDLDLVEKAFAVAFVAAEDPVSFLRLARVPLQATAADGARLVLLRVEVKGLTDVGSVTPQLGGAGFRYDPLPAKIVSHRRKLAFAYFDGTAVRRLAFDEVRGLAEAGGV